MQQTIADSYGAAFAKGVRVAVLDLNDDDQFDVLTGPGKTGGTLAKAFRGSDAALLDEWSVFATYSGGFWVAGS